MNLKFLPVLQKWREMEWRLSSIHSYIRSSLQSLCRFNPQKGPQVGTTMKERGLKACLHVAARDIVVRTRSQIAVLQPPGSQFGGWSIPANPTHEWLQLIIIINLITPEINNIYVRLRVTNSTGCQHFKLVFNDSGIFHCRPRFERDTSLSIRGAVYTRGHSTSLVPQKMR